MPNAIYLGSSSPAMSANKFTIKKRSLNALSSRNDTNSGFNAMNSTHMTTSDVSASNHRFADQPKNDSMFRATIDSSYKADSSRPSIKVVSMAIDENVQSSHEVYKRPNRLTIYRARVTSEEMRIPIILELQRDMKVTNRLFIVSREADDNTGEKRELFITLKQATNLLIKVKHVFQKFVTELLFIKHGQIAIRNLSF